MAESHIHPVASHSPRSKGDIRTRQVSSQGEIFADLLALKDEFEDVLIDEKKRTVAVETERIVLQHVDLGPFQIVLEWGNLSFHRPYQAIAQDPNPAASSFGTTHPHVRDDYVCEGEGHAPIRKALQHGRLLDFFILVRQVLENYNAPNAYLSLSNWGGLECSDCGRLVGDGDCVCCDSCEADLCSQCASSCTSCSDSLCSSHLGTCPGCQELFCTRCLAACRTCGGAFCEECLDEKKCPICRRRDAAVCESEDDSDESDEETFARCFGRADWAVMFVLARGGQTYARLRFNVGPGGGLEIPATVDYSLPFAGSDHVAWQEEYFDRVAFGEHHALDRLRDRWGWSPDIGDEFVELANRELSAAAEDELAAMDWICRMDAFGSG